MRPRTFFLLLLAIVGSTLGWLNTQPGRDFLLKQIIDSIEESGTQIIKYEKAEGFIPFYLKLHNLTLAEKDGEKEKVWLEIEEARVWVLPIPLLWKRLVIPNLILENAILHDTPSGTGKLSKLPYPTPHFIIAIDQFSIKNLQAKNRVFPWMKEEIESIQTNATGRSIIDITTEEILLDADLYDSLGKSSILFRKEQEYHPNRELSLHVEESGQGILARSFDLEPKADLKATAKFLRDAEGHKLVMPLHISIGDQIEASAKFTFVEGTIDVETIHFYAGEDRTQRVKGSLYFDRDKSIKHGEFQYEDLVVTVEGDLDDLSIDLKGYYQGLDLTGKIDWNGSHAAISLPKIEIKGEIDWPAQLEKPFIFHYKDRLRIEGAFAENELLVRKVEGILGGEKIWLKKEATLTLQTLSQATFQVGEGIGQLSYDFRAKTPTMNFLAHKLPLHPLHELLPTIAPSGMLTGSIDYDGNRGKIAMEIEKIRIDEDSKPISGKITGALMDRELKLEGKLQGLSEQPILAGITLPIEFRPGQGGIVIPMERPIRGLIKGRGEIAPFIGLVLDGTHRVKGEVAVDLTIEGTLAKPIFRGSIDMEQGKYESFTYGTVVQEIKAHAIAEGNRLRLTELSGKGDEIGAVNGSGELEIDHKKNFPYRIELQMEQMTLLQIDYAHVVAGGNIVLLGDFSQGRLEGDLRITKADIKLPNRLPEGIESLDVEYINLPPGVKTESKEITPPYPIELALRLVVPSNLSVDGRGLKSTWKGEVRVEGTTLEPELYGKLAIAKGEFQLGSKQFKINEGVLTFNGEVPDDIQLTASAAIDVNGVSITARLSGDAKSPDLTFVSNPSMPNRDILSYILFGKNATEISKMQAIQLAQTALSLGSNGIDFMGNIRKGFKLDRLEIGGKEDDLTDMTLEIGKYISKGLFISVSKNIQSDGAKVGIEADLRKGFSLQAEIDRERQTDLLLKWKRQY
jgi:hypothetical protein